MDRTDKLEIVGILFRLEKMSRRVRFACPFMLSSVSPHNFLIAEPFATNITLCWFRFIPLLVILLWVVDVLHVRDEAIVTRELVATDLAHSPRVRELDVGGQGALCRADIVAFVTPNELFKMRSLVIFLGRD